MSMNKEFVKDLLQWDVKSWSKALSYWERKVAWDEIHKGLELGGREGGLSLWLALKGKSVVCSDLNEAEKHACPLHERYEVRALVKYEDIDATNIPYENYFDVIVFKSIIGGIGRNENYELQQKVFMEVYKALKPGGKLLFAENLLASALHRQLRKRFVNWGNSWRYVSVQEIKDFLKDFPSYEIKTTGVLAAFRRNERQRNLLASLDSLALNKICPKNWRYIGYGIAEK